jgi:hypothetical protein
MNEVFVDQTGQSPDPMARTTESSGNAAAASSSSAAASPLPPIDGHVCPFCGLTREITEEFDPATPCPRCTLSDNPTTRNATKSRIGPWHVRQVRNPWAPGMRFETLLALIKHGQVTKDSIVRGPTTSQLWKRASEIKGLSREFGLCYQCGTEIDTQATICPGCNRLQEPPINPDILVETREMAASATATAATSASSAEEAKKKQAEAEKIAAALAAGPVSKRATEHTNVASASPQPGPEGEGVNADEPAQLDIGSSALPPAEHMLEADAELEAAKELARQVTTRQPTRLPERPRTPLRPRPPVATTPAATGGAAAAAPPDDALLTPQELAAAFQLDFQPSGKPSRRRGGKRIAAVLLLLLIGGGVATLLKLRPDYRDQAEQWTNKTSDSVKAFIASRTRAKSPTMSAGAAATQPSGVASHSSADPAARSQKKPEPIVIAPAPPPVEKHVAVAEEPPAEVKIAPPAPKQIETPSPVAKPPAPAAAPTPATKPAEAQPAQAVVKLTPLPAPAPAAVAIVPPPAPTPAPVAQDAKVASASSGNTNTVQMPSGDPEQQARTLWRRAMAAEANQDYREAVQCYEMIKKLPEDVRPLGLDTNLAMAKRMLK